MIGSSPNRNWNIFLIILSIIFPVLLNYTNLNHCTADGDLFEAMEIVFIGMLLSYFKNVLLYFSFRSIMFGILEQIIKSDRRFQQFTYLADLTSAAKSRSHNDIFNKSFDSFLEALVDARGKAVIAMHSTHTTCTLYVVDY